MARFSDATEPRSRPGRTTLSRPETERRRENRPTRIALCAVVGVVAVGGVLALTVYPFRYGTAESVLLVCVVAALPLFETVLDGAPF
jgi:hypothetical protein